MRAVTQHEKRIKSELIKAGVTRYGLLTLESRHLPEIIHKSEHIEAVAYGLSHNYSAMLIATDRRVIFLDRKPFFSISDEITYEMVAGIGYNIQGRFAAVTLHTRLGDYPLRFVNRKAAEKFVHYIEIRRLEQASNLADTNNPQTITRSTTEPTFKTLTKDCRDYLHSRHIGTLSSVNRTGNVTGAVVYYFVNSDDIIYILTKTDTHKAHNIFAHHQVALTVYSAKSRQTLQVQGIAEVETDKDIKSFVFYELTRPRKYEDGQDLPPVAKINDGGFMVIRIVPTSATFHDYGERN